ncbi:MAG TPA: hypothetical protein VLT33_27400 [Labilithrix sp.]|nr:hypothetical protein [Labilithrix sp.]
MSRVVVMAAVLAFLPPACAKLMGKAPPAEPEVVAPPPPPITSATTPPAWHPPEPVGTASAATAGPGSPPPPSADLLKARAAAEAKDFKKVRSLLEKKVRAGKCAPEESQLVFKACTVLKDKPCIAEVKARHPDDLTAE